MTVDQVRVLDDRYALDELVGSGGMADVYRATDRLLGRQVAVKVLRETSAGPHRARFADEARTLASLNHPGLITLLDAGFEGDRPYLVMELADGPTLASAIAQGPLDPVEVARIGGELAAALAYAHGSGVIHRDVKPSNVLLCDDGRVLLADFGIARLVDATDHHTRPGEAIGSPAYLAPEQVSGDPLTPAVDVFALGLVLLEALTGVRAYAGPPVEAAVARLTAAPEIPPTLGERWCRLVAAMTAREPQGRPTAAEVTTRLVPVVTDEQVADPTAVLVVDDGALTQPMRAPLTRRARRSLLLGGAAVGLLALITSVLVLLTRPADSTAEVDVSIPAGVPAALQEPLRALHRAVAESGSEVSLDAIDDALVDERWGVARNRLTALVRSTDDGEVLAAAARLLAALPAPAPVVSTVTATPTPVARAQQGPAEAAPPGKAKGPAKGGPKKGGPKKRGPGKKG